MNILAIVPLRIASLREIRQPETVQCKILSERTLVSRFQYFIEKRDWEEYLCHKLVDKLCLGAIILSIIYFCFHSGASLTAMVFQNYG
jgi:hypothetical protein